MRFSSRRYRWDTARRYTFTATRRKSSTFWTGSSKSPKVTATAGAIVVGPRDIPHTFRNVGSQDAQLLLTVIPGRFANYFIEVDGVDDGDHAAIRALAAKYDVEILE